LRRRSLPSMMAWATTGVLGSMAMAPELQGASSARLEKVREGLEACSGRKKWEGRRARHWRAGAVDCL
jgi:hypothetical protein